MKQQGNTGSGLVSVFFILLFVASIALNAMFLVGCDILPGCNGVQRRPSVGYGGSTDREHFSETSYLREIARKLGIDEPMDKTPGDIAFDIEQRLQTVERYRGETLSDESAADVKAQILESSDAQTFADYHAFMRKIAGKKIIIVE